MKTFRLSDNNTAGSNFAGYGHLGDLDHCLHDGIDYLLLPLTGGGPTIIAFFRADNLTFVNYSYLPGQKDTSIGWCAYHPVNGKIYTSNDDAKAIKSFNIHWELVNNKHHDALTFDTSYPLSGMIHNMQGGEFTSDGKLLYVSSGVISRSGSWPSDGISVLDASSWKVIAHSSNQRRGETSCFDFSFQDFDNFYLGDEPEGLTLWDIDGKGSPRAGLSNLTGQLHVLLDNHDITDNSHLSPTVQIFHYMKKDFTSPSDISIFAVNSTGESVSNPVITSFLHPANTYGSCASITNDAPSLFPPGKTIVSFVIKENGYIIGKTSAAVNIINAHDESNTSLQINSCEKIITDNFGASASILAPPISNYNGTVHDAWFKLDPTNGDSILVETLPVPGGLTHTVMQVLSGDVDHLKEVASDDGRNNNLQAKIVIANPGGITPLYIRITNYEGTTTGKFGLYCKKIAHGAAIFKESVFIAGEGPIQHPAMTGDVNGDKKTDLIFAIDSLGQGLVIRTKLSQGDGTFKSVEQIIGWGSGIFTYPPMTADLNGDGKTDLVFSGLNWQGNGLNIISLIANGDGTYQNHNEIMGDDAAIVTGYRFNGDVNGDGKTDLIFTHYVNGKGLFVNTKFSKGNGSFTSGEFLIAWGPGIFDAPPLAADINGDGKIDLIFTGKDWQGPGLNVICLLSIGNGSFTSNNNIMGDDPLILQGTELTGDVDGDGKADLIFAVDDPDKGLVLTTKFSKGNGTFVSTEEVIGWEPGIFSHSVMAGDVNGDGKTDLLFAGKDWQVCGLNMVTQISKGNGTWCTAWQGSTDGAEMQQYAFVTADINGDNKTDLIFIHNDPEVGLVFSNKIAAGSSLCQPVKPTNTTPPVDSSQISNPPSNPFASPYVVYPNPAQIYLRIKTERPSTLDIRIFDMHGNIWIKYEKIESSRQLDIRALPTGIYMLGLTDRNTGATTNQKFVKIN